MVITVHLLAERTTRVLFTIRNEDVDGKFR